MNSIELTLGALTFAVAGWYLTHPVVWLIRKTVPVPTPWPPLEAAWKELVSTTDYAGLWLGCFERAVFLLCFATGREEGVAVLLAFKVASKWEAWSNITKVPERLSPSAAAADTLRYAYCRRVWAAQANATFLIGTLLNILIGYVGADLAERYLRIPL